MQRQSRRARNLYLNIIHEDREFLLQIPHQATVGQLKAKIYEKLKIAPEDQVIEPWLRPPQDDNDTLNNCCHTETNVLIVYNAVNNEDDAEAYKESLKSLELRACINFIEKFSPCNENNHILFNGSLLEDVLQQVCFVPPEKRKVVLLFLYNESDPFARQFGTYLTNSDNISKYFLLGWDLEDRQCHKALTSALGKIPELSFISSYIENRNSVTFLIIPGNDSLITLRMRSDMTQNDIINTLTQADLLFEAENSNKCETDTSGGPLVMGPVECQQLMLDLLGDRDYDQFDFKDFEQLKEKIAFALYGPPTTVDGYPDELKKNVERLFDIIVKENNKFAEWKDSIFLSFIFNCLIPPSSSENSDNFSQIPIFVIRKCHSSPSNTPCRIFVDNAGRVYQSWEDYINRNKLPKCKMMLPLNGRYEADDDGKVMLETHLSPSCRVDVKVLKGVDAASSAAGLASGGVFLAAAIPSIVVAPIALATAAFVGLGVGLYSVARSAYTLHDRHTHRETLSITNSEARGAYLNIAAGCVGVVGTGATMTVSKLASFGVNIGQTARGAVDVINIANISTSGLGMANSTYEVLNQWINEKQAPSFLTVLQLSSSILFFGHAVYNFKSAATIIEDTQTATLKDYESSLRSNRHRKTFNKMLKETIKQNDGNRSVGQAEVIKTVTTIQNKDEVFAALTRLNKELNKKSIKFSADGGTVKLNGVAVDMVLLGKMQKNEAVTFLSGLSSGAEPSPTDVQAVNTKLFATELNAEICTKVSITILKIIGNTDDTIQERIINAFIEVVKALKPSSIYGSLLRDIFPGLERYVQLFNMVSEFFQIIVNEVERRYQEWLKTKEPNFEEPYFAKLALDVAKRTKQIFEIATKLYFCLNQPTEYAIKEIIRYFATWITKKALDRGDALERKKLRKEHSADWKAVDTKCSICGGQYYEPSS